MSSKKKGAARPGKTVKRRASRVDVRLQISEATRAAVDAYRDAASLADWDTAARILLAHALSRGSLTPDFGPDHEPRFSGEGWIEANPRRHRFGLTILANQSVELGRLAEAFALTEGQALALCLSWSAPRALAQFLATTDDDNTGEAWKGGAS